MISIIPIYKPPYVVERGLPIRDLKELAQAKKFGASLIAACNKQGIFCEVTNYGLGNFPLIRINWYNSDKEKDHVYPFSLVTYLIKHISTFEKQIKLDLMDQGYR